MKDLLKRYKKLRREQRKLIKIAFHLSEKLKKKRKEVRN